MLTVKRLSLEDARILLEGAEARSREMGVPMCVAVTDESGSLISFMRMDGAKVSSIDIAINKAWTAAAARRGTHEYNQAAVPGKPTFGIHTTNDGRFTIIGGGLPVVIDGEIVGGVGASTGSAEEDQWVAQAAIDHLLSRLGT
ncbi:MAG TPA: heme-binding protein [Dehalococcoidia bacterium]|nr:heme-binding protein [Dehalococcoidia bacterium]